MIHQFFFSEINLRETFSGTYCSNFQRKIIVITISVAAVLFINKKIFLHKNEKKNIYRKNIAEIIIPIQ